MYQLFIDGIKLDGTDRSTVKAYGVQDLHLEIKKYHMAQLPVRRFWRNRTKASTYVLHSNYDVHIYGIVSGTSPIVYITLTYFQDSHSKTYEDPENR